MGKTINLNTKNKITILQAKNKISEKNEIMGFLIERSLYNGSSMDDTVWQFIYLDGSNAKRFLKGFAEPREFDEYLDEVKEKIEQIKEVAKLIDLQLE